MQGHQPDAVLICIDVPGLIELTVVQAGAQVGRHTGPSVAQVRPSRAETTFLTQLLPAAASLGPGQSTARSLTDTPTRLVHLACRALHLWSTSKHRTGDTLSQVHDGNEDSNVMFSTSSCSLSETFTREPRRDTLVRYQSAAEFDIFSIILMTIDVAVSQ